MATQCDACAASFGDGTGVIWIDNVTARCERCRSFATHIEAETVAAIVGWLRAEADHYQQPTRQRLWDVADAIERNDWKRGGHG